MVPEDTARDLVQIVRGAYTRERPTQSRAEALQGLSEEAVDTN